VTIAFSTTLITIKRAELATESDRDPWERDDPDTEETDESGPGEIDTLATGVRADISINQGRSGGPGDTQTIEFLLICDPTELSFRDLVIDESTGQQYSVQWANPTGTLGFEHVQAGLKSVTGFGNE
jgi:hypothetical protein